MGKAAKLYELRQFLSAYDGSPGICPASVVEETLEKIRRLEADISHEEIMREFTSLHEYRMGT